MDLSQVTLTQMRYAVAVANSLNFRLAAAECHVSQSGLSMQVSRLEELIETTLFDRSKKPIGITPAGDLALSQIRRVLRETERLGQVVKESTEPSGRFRLGIIPTLSTTVTPLFIQRFVAGYPRVELAIEELRTADLVARLHGDTLDAGIAAIPLAEPGIVEHSLSMERMFAYLPPDDPLLKRDSLTQSQFSERALWLLPEGHCFRSQVLAYCGGEKPKAPAPVSFESGSFETLVRLVDRGMGATVLPELVAMGLSSTRRKKQLRPLVAPVPLREIGLLTAKSDLRPRVSSAVIEVVRAALSALLTEAPTRSVVLQPT
jgi:LysR family transcriptional regulator, hydrogen peroxide-inducible genes activator